jgi:hypothetical protein
MATNNNEIPMNLHPPGVDQLDGVRKITRAMEDLADRVSDQQTAPNRGKADMPFCTAHVCF